MKHNKIALLAAAVLAGAGLWSCSDNPDYGLTDVPQGMAQVSLKGMDVEVDLAETVYRAPSAYGSRAVSTGAFLVNITDAEGTNLLSTTMDARPEIMALPVGEGYTVTVESHSQAPVAWDAPYYAGSETFNVVENEITEIGTIIAKFMNIRVSVNYSDELLALIEGDASVRVDCSQSGAYADFSTTETRSAYFEAADGSTTLGATFTGTVKGQTVNLTKAISNVAAGNHHILNFSVRHGDPTLPDEFGNIDMSGTGEGVELGDGLWLNITTQTVDIDGNITTEEPVDNTEQRPGQEDPAEPEDPEDPEDPSTGDDITITAPGMSFTAVMTPSDGTDGRVFVEAPGKIENLIVTIITDSDEFRGVLESEGILGTTTFDLANITDPHLQEALGPDPGFGFAMNEEVKGQTSVNFDISPFIPLLNIYQGLHKFEIKVVDQSGKSETKTLSFRVA